MQNDFIINTGVRGAGQPSPLSLLPLFLSTASEALPHVVPICHDVLTGFPLGTRALTPLTPNTVELISTLGALGS